MSVATAEPVTGFDIDPYLFKASVDAVSSSLAMCNIAARCVGISKIPTHEPGIITGLIGVHGKVSGFITVNMAEAFALAAVGGLLQDSYPTLTSQVVDGVGEITNLIVGGVKKSLSTTPWAFSNITVPSVIVGSGYKMAFARGLDYICATFEQSDSEAVMLDDRILQLSISLLRL